LAHLEALLVATLFTFGLAGGVYTVGSLRGYRETSHKAFDHCSYGLRESFLRQDKYFIAIVQNFP